MKKTKLLQKSKNFALTFIVILSFSCQEESHAPVSETIEESENFITMEEANGIASKLKYQPFDDGKFPIQAKTDKNLTRAKIVKNTTAVPDEDGKIVYYVINYEDSGFIVLSADNRVNPVLAFSASGRFPIKETQYPSGLVAWLAETKDLVKNVRRYNIKQSKEVKEAWTKSIIQNLVSADILSDGVVANRIEPIDPGPIGPGNPGGCANKHEFIGPLLQTSWGQWGVYNDLAPNLGCANADGRAPTGCVATAMAQIMRFHEFPNNYSWFNMPDNWGTMETAQLMRDIGDDVNMEFGCNGSGADTEDEVASSFRNDFGYASASYADYNSETVTNNIRSGRPVILKGGRNTGWWIFGVYSDGHA